MPLVFAPFWVKSSVSELAQLGCTLSTYPSLRLVAQLFYI